MVKPAFRWAALRLTRPGGLARSTHAPFWRMFMRIRRRLTALFLLFLTVAGAQQAAAQAAAVKQAPFARLAVNNGELEYRVQGAGEPVLLIHGSIFSSVVFDRLLPEA